MSDLVVLNNTLPIREYPEEKLNQVIFTHFTPWLCRLLSLTDEKSADRLEVALPAIKEHCWSLGFDEVKKMFEMYADNKLGIEPRDNYFTRALFGKIAQAYKQQRPAKKKEIVIPEISEAEKLLRTNGGVVRCYQEYKETGVISAGYAWAYDHLYDNNILKVSNEKKKEVYAKAKEICKNLVDLKKAGSKNILQMIEEKGSKKVINKSKNILLKEYFDLVEIDDLKLKLNNIKT